MRALLSMMILVGGCGGGRGGGGSGEEGSECRSSDQCRNELECSGVNDGPGCGIPAREECFDDSACGMGLVCHAIPDFCSFDGIGSQCDVPCIDNMSCGGAGFVCDAGNCVAELCDGGFVCEDREVCDPARIAITAAVFDKHHGCFAVTCDADAACGIRFCVNGICQDAVGACVEPMLVP